MTSFLFSFGSTSGMYSYVITKSSFMPSHIENMIGLNSSDICCSTIHSGIIMDLYLRAAHSYLSEGFKYSFSVWLI